MVSDKQIYRAFRTPTTLYYKTQSTFFGTVHPNFYGNSVIHWLSPDLKD